MDTVIREINESLLKILSDLESRQLASQNELEMVNSKINEKVDEAKEYKIEVDNAKNKIKALEKEIESLEIDLTDLNERFGKKDLNAILEAGNREINSKIMEKQNQITKHRQKIGELTERARSIKDLLINLKKDKSIKEEKLEILTKSYDYYRDSLNKIIDFAKNNPNSLNSYDISYNSLNYDYSKEPLTEVFDEIESMDKEDEDNEEASSETKNLTNEKFIKDEESNLTHEEFTEDEESNLNNIFEKLRNKALDFEEINKSIDKEYDDIFGNSEEINLNEKINISETKNENLLNISEEELNNHEEESFSNIFNNSDMPDVELPDIFGNNQVIKEKEESSSEIADFFSEYNLDYNQFTNEDQEIIKNIFTKDHFHKMMEILKNNQLDLEKIFGAVKLLEKGTPEELDQIITKLLLANQTKANIELALNNLGNITIANLTEVINSYGPNIKEANIADLIMKTRKMSGTSNINERPSYLTQVEFTEDEISIMEASIKHDIWEIIVCFPELILTNYRLLKDIGISNIKEIFMDHTQMFTKNPDKFKAIFAKYDKKDLIRCLEKNASVIEKL